MMPRKKLKATNYVMVLVGLISVIYGVVNDEYHAIWFGLFCMISAKSVYTQNCIDELEERVEELERHLR